MKYLDTVIEDVDRIQKGRKHISLGIALALVMFLVFYFMSTYFYYINYLITGCYIMILGTSFLILLTALVIKREIYGLAIILKEIKEHGK